MFLEALSSLMENRDSLIDDCRAVMHVLGDCKAIDREMEEVRSEMEVTTGLIQKLIDEMPRGKWTRMITGNGMTDTSAGMPHWKAGWTAWRKNGKRGNSNMIFSADSCSSLGRFMNCRLPLMTGCSIS